MIVVGEMATLEQPQGMVTASVIFLLSPSRQESSIVCRVGMVRRDRLGFVDAPSRTQKSVAQVKAHPLLEYKVCVGRVVQEAGRLPGVVVDVIRVVVVVDEGGGLLL